MKETELNKKNNNNLTLCTKYSCNKLWWKTIFYKTGAVYKGQTEKLSQTNDNHVVCSDCTHICHPGLTEAILQILEAGGSLRAQSGSGEREGGMGR